MIDITKAVKNVPIKYYYNNHDNYNGVDKDKCLEKFDDWLKLEGVERTPDMAFSTWMTCEIGVTPIPCFSFYEQDNTEGNDGIKGTKNVNLIRFAHCKDDETIEYLDSRLSTYYSK